MAVLIVFLVTLAPYEYVITSKFLFYSPLLFTLLAFIANMWIPYLDFDGHDRPPVPGTRNDQMYVSKNHIESFEGGRQYGSALFLIFSFVILFGFLREHISTFRARVDYWPSNSLQFNSVGGYLLPSRYSF